MRLVLFTDSHLCFLALPLILAGSLSVGSRRGRAVTFLLAAFLLLFIGSTEQSPSKTALHYQRAVDAGASSISHGAAEFMPDAADGGQATTTLDKDAGEDKAAAPMSKLRRRNYVQDTAALGGGADNGGFVHGPNPGKDMYSEDYQSERRKKRRSYREKVEQDARRKVVQQADEGGEGGGAPGDAAGTYFSMSASPRACM